MIVYKYFYNKQFLYKIDCDLSNESIEELAELISLSKIPSLNCINLSNNNSIKKSFNILCESLLHGQVKFEHMIFNNCGLNDESLTELSNIINSGKLFTLKTIELADNKFSYDSVHYFSQMLSSKKSPLIETVNLSSIIIYILLFFF